MCGVSVNTLVMTNYENVMPVITSELKRADDYLESENVLVENIKQQVKEGLPLSVIKDNLQKLHAHITSQVQGKNISREVINLKYAAAYLKTLITTPYWQSWIEIA